ncbi:hypothetical protein N7508_009720 [Penicillium antarcticum]|uniref:uncharacterized protein n=1 Tax=Penicillium antarcticum TaxID=416450 RepID=UPI002383FD54|nr:uncharacterized protein N7508_009720 [Penicillium antarcticum]KAJ5294899.1 hypothetical protein N7508_009720 [Penicillium antarcticum]
MFKKPLPALALLIHASTLTFAADTVQIGYYAGLVGNLPGPEPSLGCGLWAQVTDGQTTALADFVSSGGVPSDSCPAADLSLFCSRWGCPFVMTFDQVLALTVESDNSGDKSITVSATGLNGPTATVTCPWSIETISKDSSGSLYQTWLCDLSALG